MPKNPCLKQKSLPIWATVSQSVDLLGKGCLCTKLQNQTQIKNAAWLFCASVGLPCDIGLLPSLSRWVWCKKDNGLKCYFRKHLIPFPFCNVVSGFTWSLMYKNFHEHNLYFFLLVLYFLYPSTSESDSRIHQNSLLNTADTGSWNAAWFYN